MSKIYEKEVFAEMAEAFDEVDRRVLLWTNPNLTVNFNAGTVSLDLTTYDAVEIEFALWTSDPRPCCTRRGLKGQECVASTISSNSTKGNTGNTFASTIVNQMRAFTASDTGVTFSQAVEATAGASFGAQNHSLIPYKIYGIQLGASAGDGSSGGTMNYPDLLHKPTINGVTLVEGLVTEDLNLGDTAHEEVTKAEFDALADEKKNDGTVYFITDGLSGSIFLDDNVPVGTIAPFGGTTDPSYWLICDGRAVSRTDYASLFSVIGTSYGAGDGSTTFNIPDFTGNVAVGASSTLDLGDTGGESTHVLVAGELPILTGTLPHQAYGEGAVSGVFSVVDSGANVDQASNASSPTNRHYELHIGNDEPHNNMQPYVVTNYIIKYDSTVSRHQANIDFFYPVGSYYETSNASFDPNVTWGGTWISEEAVDDYIVDEGVDGIWTYRKWASGISECWGVHSISLTHYATSGGFYGFTTSQTFPANLFIERPTGRYNCTIDSAFSISAANLGLDKDHIQLYGLSNAGNTQPTTWDIEVKGIWKTLDINTKFKWHRTA